MALEFSLDEEDVLQLHAQVRVLLDAELYESAIDAAQVAISASGSLQAPPTIGMGSICDANVMAGDAARGLGEAWRAEAYYKEALRLIELDDARSRSLEGQALTGGVKLKLAKCLVASERPDEALAVLRSISARVRPPAAVVLMAKLFITVEGTRESKSTVRAAFKESLRLCPFALELFPYFAAHGLDSTTVDAQLRTTSVPAVSAPAGSVVESVAGVVWGTFGGAAAAADDAAGGGACAAGAGGDERLGTPAVAASSPATAAGAAPAATPVPATGPSVPSSRVPAASPSPYGRDRSEIRPGNVRWLAYLAKSHEGLVTGQSSFAQSVFNSLHMAFPACSSIGYALAMVHSRRKQREDALQVAQAVRKRDPFTVRGVDSLTKFLAENDSSLELALLAQEAMELDPERPEAWLALALALALNGKQFAKAMDMAHRKGSSHPGVLYMIGSLHLSLKAWEQSTAVFRRAAEIRGDVGTLRGLCRSLIYARKLSSALAVANRLMKLAPNSAHAHQMLGCVLSQSENKREQGEKELWTAHRLDPADDDVAAELSIVLHRLGRSDEAVSVLRKALLCRQSSRLQVRLGRLMRSLGKPREAMAAYHTALSLNPRQSDARDGLRELEMHARDLGARAETGDDDVAVATDHSDEN